MLRRIGLNLQPLASTTLTGIGTYTLEITKRLQGILGDGYLCEGHVFDFGGRNHAADRVKMFLSSNSNLSERPLEYINENTSKKTFGNLQIKTCKLFPLGAYIRAGILGRIVSYQQLIASEADTTVFFNYLRPDRVKGKSIITVYDMVSERFPETMDRRNRRLLNGLLEKSCRKADAIITISEFSKKEIIACLGISPEKIHVALCGIDQEIYFPPKDEAETKYFNDCLREKYQISSPYILYLGTLEPRKNVDVLLDAFSILHKRLPELKLVICGGLGWQYEKTLTHLSNMGMAEAVIYTGYIPETDKRMIYANAEVFVFPSLYEGFGLPVLEAMACGAPVVCSNSSSLPEVVGQAGLLCDPWNAQSFAESIETMITDMDLRTTLKERQKNQVRLFTWENAAQVYGQVILNVVKSQE